jgi:hypothetical protein
MILVFGNGIMIRQGSRLAQGNMHFESDKSKYQQKLKSDKRKSDRKKERQIISREFETE